MHEQDPAAPLAVSWQKRPDVSSVAALLELAKDRSRAGREVLAMTIGDLFNGEDSVLSPRERALTGEILTRLVKDVEINVRRGLARRLAGNENVPRALIVELANDEIEVALPILQRSQVLRDLDLIEIIRHRTMEHCLAVAMRAALSEQVSDALVETDEPAVVETLLRNRDAAIAPDTLARVVEHSRTRRNYQEPLLHRAELPPELARRMYWWISAALRESILERFAFDPDDFDDAMEGAVHGALAEDDPAARAAAPPNVPPGPSGNTSDHASDDISDDTPAPFDETAQNELVVALRKGDVGQFQKLLQKVTGLRPRILRRLIFEPGGERFAIACRAVQMTPQIFSAIYRLVRAVDDPAGRMPRGELTRIAALYLDIQPPLAAEVLRRWRRDPDYMAAIAQVTGKVPLG